MEYAVGLAGTQHELGAILINGASYATGQVNEAFRFDGVDDRVQVADSPSLALTESLTIEAWVRADSIPASDASMIFSRGDDRSDPYSLYLMWNGAIAFSVIGGTDGTRLATSMPLGEFVHVASTLDDATGAMRLYFNGVLMAQTTTTIRPFADLDPNSNPGVGIGNSGGYPNTPHNLPFHGLIDELKIYNHALSAEDVLADFNASKGSMQPTVLGATRGDRHQRNRHLDRRQQGRQGVPLLQCG